MKRPVEDLWAHYYPAKGTTTGDCTTLAIKPSLKPTLVKFEVCSDSRENMQITLNKGAVACLIRQLALVLEQESYEEEKSVEIFIKSLVGGWDDW